MRSLGAFVLLPLMLLIAAIFAARWVGSHSPLPSLTAALFTERDGSVCRTPCILGVRPDQADMFAAMKAHPLLKPMEFYITGNDLDKTENYHSDLVAITGNEYRQWVSVSLNGSFPAASESILTTPRELQGSFYLG